MTIAVQPIAAPPPPPRPHPWPAKACLPWGWVSWAAIEQEPGRLGAGVAVADV